MESNTSYNDASDPLITIIMPIRNEEAFIERSLNAILSQDYPSNRMEIIIVDGMSSDHTREIIFKIIQTKSEKIDNYIQANDLPPLIIIDNRSKFVPKALNIGLKRAKGEIIIRVDGHCEISSNYIRRCIEAIRVTGADCVGGIQRAVGSSRVGNAIALVTSTPFGIGNSKFHYAEKSGWVDTVYLGAYKREVFDKIGIFDEELIRNQDDEFNYRLLQADGRIWLDINIHSIYHSRGTIKNLCRQYFEYGIYKVRVIQKRKAVPSIRHLVPGAFVLAIAASIILSLILNDPIWMVPVIGSYLLMNILVSLWTARGDLRIVFVLPVAFLCLHVSYGLGFLWGIWKWRRYFSVKNMFKDQR